MKILAFSFTFLTVVFLLLSTVVTCEETQAEESAFEMPDDLSLLKMKVRQLKDILRRKGDDADCVACTSKQEYVDRIHETASWPDVTPSPSASPELTEEDLKTREELEKLFSKKKDPAYMEEMKKKLEAAGIDPSQVFMGNQLNPEVVRRYKPGAENGDGASSDDASTDDASTDDAGAGEQEEEKTDL